MDFTYTIKKKDLVKYLKERHRTTNIFCLILFVFLAIMINFKVFMDNTLLMTIGLIILVVVVALFIMLVNHIFIKFLIRNMENKKLTFGRHHVKVDNKHIEDTIHKNTLSILWTDVRDITMDERMIVIKPKDQRVNLVFHQSILKKEHYDGLKKWIENNYKR